MAQDYLAKLLAFGDDIMLTSLADADALQKEIIAHKDRTLLLCAERINGLSIRNFETILENLASGQLELENHRERVTVPIRTLVILFTQSDSLLASFPEVVPVQMSQLDFDVESCGAFLAKGAFRVEY